MIRGFLRQALPETLVARLRRNSTLQRLTGRRMTVGVGRGLKFDPGDSNSDYGSGHNELPVQEAIARSLNPGDVFYDIGANVGFFTVIGAKLVGARGAVYAFEPVPQNVVAIRNNLQLNRFANVTVVQKAVASTSGIGELSLAAYSGGSALATVPPPPDATSVVSVELVSIDDLVFENRLPPPTVIKIDVEGAEIAVLKGMIRTLREVRPMLVYEIDDARPEEFESKRKACRAFLEDLNYNIEDLPNSYPNINWLVGHSVATRS